MLSKYLLATLGALVWAIAAKAEPVTLKFATGYPTGAFLNGFVVPWAKKIEEDSKGTLKIHIFADGRLAKIGDTVDRVASGVADMGWDNPQAMGARFASFGITTLPGIYTDSVAASKAAWRAWEDGTFAQEFKNENVTPIVFYGAPSYVYMLKNCPADLSSLSGQRIALSSKVRAELTSAMGGQPMAFGPPDYYQSLQRGIIDGVFTALIAVLDSATDEILHCYIRGPFGGSVTAFFINNDVYASLPPEAKKAIDDNSGAFGSEWAGKVNVEYEDAQWQKRILSKPKNKVVTLAGEDLQNWQKVFDSAANAWVQQTANGKMIFDGYKKALSEVQGAN